METQFVTDEKGIKTAAIIPLEEWERMEKAKDLLEQSTLPVLLKNVKQPHKVLVLMNC